MRCWNSANLARSRSTGAASRLMPCWYTASACSRGNSARGREIGGQEIQGSRQRREHREPPCACWLCEHPNGSRERCRRHLGGSNQRMRQCRDTLPGSPWRIRPAPPGKWRRQCSRARAPGRCRSPSERQRRPPDRAGSRPAARGQRELAAAGNERACGACAPCTPRPGPESHSTQVGNAVPSARQAQIVRPRCSQFGWLCSQHRGTGREAPHILDPDTQVAYIPRVAPVGLQLAGATLQQWQKLRFMATRSKRLLRPLDEPARSRW